MEAVASRPLALISRRRLISTLVVALSCGLTAVMSVMFHRRIQLDMMTTGFVSAVIINHVVGRITRHYRHQLRLAHATLERRVRERTADLERALAEQTALRDELMAKDRMATAGMIAASVSHEIRSPLGVIRIAVDEVQDLIADADAHALVTDISDATDRITTILRDLSSIAKPVDDPLSALQLSSVIDTATRLASYRFGKNVTLERGCIEVPPVVGNASRLVQLLMNLLHNAARASRTGARNTIRVNATTRDDHVVLAISDTGSGMSPETQQRLFEPFFTTGRTTGGTGLGLTICKSIVERMGGTIAIASELGAGTTVTVTLRRASAN
jgi:signal transduction histidine kinase